MRGPRVIGSAVVCMFGLGCGPSAEECSALLRAMETTGEAAGAPIAAEEGAKLVATRVSSGADGVAAVAVKHAELKKSQTKYVDRARRLGDRLPAWKSGAAADDITTLQLKSLAEDLRETHGDVQRVCAKK